MLCGQKALCSLISLAGLTTLVTLGETTVLGAGWGHGDRTGQKKKKQKPNQPATAKKAQEWSGVFGSEPRHRLKQNLEQAKGSGYDQVES